MEGRNNKPSLWWRAHLLWQICLKSKQMLGLRTGTGQCWVPKDLSRSNKWLRHQEVLCDATESTEPGWPGAVVGSRFISWVTCRLIPRLLSWSVKMKMVLTSQGVCESEMK